MAALDVGACGDGRGPAEGSTASAGVSAGCGATVRLGPAVAGGRVHRQGVAPLGVGPLGRDIRRVWHCWGRASAGGGAARRGVTKRGHQEGVAPLKGELLGMGSRRAWCL